MPNRSVRFNRLPMGEVVAVILLGSPLIVYGNFHLSRPTAIARQEVLFPGITYKHSVKKSFSRPVSIHIVEIDLKHRGIEVFVTPPSIEQSADLIQARTTSEFLREFDLQLAINANFFYPFREKTPWDYYPKSGDGVNVVGLAIGNGQSYGKSNPDFPALCFSATNKAQIVERSHCPSGTVEAIAGSQIIVDRNRPSIKFADTSFSRQPYPRTAVATNVAGDKLWLFIIDGKQPFYSEGVTLAELAQIVLQPGVYRALNLDGGGSTTLAIATPTGARSLNSPIQNKLPMQERPVANHLGFRALQK
jgi:hypothetical protein